MAQPAGARFVRIGRLEGCAPDACVCSGERTKILGLSRSACGGLPGSRPLPVPLHAIHSGFPLSKRLAVDRSRVTLSLGEGLLRNPHPRLHLGRVIGREGPTVGHRSPTRSGVRPRGELSTSPRARLGGGHPNALRGALAASVLPHFRPPVRTPSIERGNRRDPDWIRCQARVRSRLFERRLPYECPWSHSRTCAPCTCGQRPLPAIQADAVLTILKLSQARGSVKKNTKETPRPLHL